MESSVRGSRRVPLAFDASSCSMIGGIVLRRFWVLVVWRAGCLPRRIAKPAQLACDRPMKLGNTRCESLLTACLPVWATRLQRRFAAELGFWDGLELYCCR